MAHKGRLRELPLVMRVVRHWSRWAREVVDAPFLEVFKVRDGVRKAKAQLELNLASDAMNNKGFYRYINQKRKVKESRPPLMNKNGDLVSTDEEKAEVLKNIFASAFTGNHSPHPSRANGQHVGDQGVKVPPTVREDQVRDYLRNLNI
ncbi:hypothetical protein QYF61_009194 [Mycteria americana]|uniref:Uncharacterized protein n=1 Tax=Mycteria americana TaxID=33587 RepID=A0AAN7NJD9_MYCAM|nr:hypothetical protein QYF61_009194 [Mycteria americana]